VNAANELSEPTASTVTVDSTAPAVPVLSFAADTGSSASDFITTNGTVNVAGLESTTRWEYSVNSGSTYTTGSGTSFVVPAGSYAFGTIRVRQWDNFTDNVSDIAYLGEGPTQRASGVSGSYTDSTPLMVGLPNGGYVLGWTGGTATQGTDVFLQRYAENGAATGSLIQLQAAAGNFADRLRAITPLTGGGHLVTWTGQVSATQEGVTAQRYDSAWSPVGSPVSLTSSGAFGATSVVALSDGGFVITSVETNPTQTDSQIAVRRYDASGVAVGTQLSLGETSSSNPAKLDQNPLIFDRGAGKYAVVWRGRADGVNDNLYLQNVNASGAAEGAAVMLQDSASITDPQVVRLNDGRLVSVSTSSGNIRVQYYSEAGVLDSSKTLSINGGKDASNNDLADTAPKVALLNDGSYVIVWGSSHSATVNSVMTNLGTVVWAQRFTAEGVGGTKTWMSTSSGADDSPVVTALSTGGFAVAWLSTINDTTGLRDIYSYNFNSSGTVSHSAALRMGTQSLTESNLAIAGLTNGRYTVGWDVDNGDGQAEDVFSRIFNPADSVQVDATAPTLSGTAPSTATTTVAGTAGNSAGEAIALTITFDGNVDGLTSGTNSTIFKVAGTGVSATWSGTDGSTTRMLTYTVQAGQNGAATIDEAALKTALEAGIKDRAGNAFTYTANSGVIADIDSTALPVIDTTAPTATVTTATAHPTTSVMVQSSEIGTAYLVKTSVPVSNLASITSAADNQSNSVSVTAASTDTSLSLSGLEDGSYSLYTVDAAGNLSAASSGTVTVLSNPIVSSVAITGASGDQNSTLNFGDVVTATVVFSENVTVTGTPQLALNIGGSTVQANYAAGSGTNSLTFTYTIVAEQNDSNGISIAANALTLNGGTLKDGDGNDATLTHALVADNASYKVDTALANVILSIPDNGTISTDGITSSNTVTLTGLEAGASWEYSVNGGTSWTSGSGTSFTVAAGDYATSSIRVKQTDLAGNVNVSQVGSVFQRLSGMAGNLEDVLASNAAVTSIASGGYYFLWRGDTSDGRSRDVFLQRFDAAGAVAGSEVRLTAVAGNSYDAPYSIAALSSGVYGVFWTTSGSRLLYLQRYDSAGSPVSTMTTVMSSAADSLSNAVLKVLSDQSYVMAWQVNPANSNYNILVQKYSSAGTAVGSQVVLNLPYADTANTSTITLDMYPSVLDTGGGTYQVAWRGRFDTVDETYVQGFDAAGATSGSYFKLSRSSVIPTVDVLPNGDILNVGNENTSSPDYGSDIFVRRFSSSGTLLSTTRLTGTEVSGLSSEDYSAKLALLSDGGYAVAWLGRNSISSTTQNFDIWVQRFDASGSVLGSKTFLSGTTGNYLDDSVTIKALSDGRYVVAWSGDTSDSQGRDVYFQTFNADGSLFGTKERLSAFSGAYDDTNPQIAALTDGKFVVSWESTTPDSQGKDVFTRMVERQSLTIDTTAPTTTVTAASIFSSGSASVQSTETGTAYLVNTSITVSNLSSITTAADHLWNQVSIGTANAATSLAATGLVDGSYQLYAVDAAGNLSAASSDSISIVSPIVQLSAIAAGSGGFAINGEIAHDYLGTSVSSAGDVNGDGLTDLIVGANLFDTANAGRSYLVFGRTGTTPINASAIVAGTGGFAINGQCSGDQSGISVSAAGDVNGDGLADLIVGAYLYDTEGANNFNNGRSYVIFGRTATSAVNLSAIAGGTGGFAINGQAASGDQSGISVSAAGDVNGDGLADLIIGAHLVDASGTDSGRSYVVFGKSSDTTAINLSAVLGGTGGFAINGQGASDGSGFSVSAAGDVNGDGLGDLIVGAYLNDSGGADAGRSYVVFGRTATTTIDLSAVAGGTGGFAINAQAAGDLQGRSVSYAGDVNGDGLADLIVGALQNDAGGVDAGRSYVIFGRTATAAVDLSAIADGVGGFVINAESAGDNNGTSVSNAGDINGDGLADLIIGAHKNDTGGADTGRSYVVFGRTAGSAIDLSAVAAGTGGFAINGQAAGDATGWSVAAAGDVNGDGLADLIVGARVNDTGGTDVGRAYVIFGSTTGGAFMQTAVDTLGTSGADSISDSGTARTLVGDAGNDTLTATGASVLYGGSGDDTFNINGTMITALQAALGAGGNTGQLARIDGGSGLDTLALSGAGLTLDLSQVANQAAGNPDGGSRIDSIEKIDLTGSGNNTLNLSASDVRDMAGFNSFQASGRRQLMVLGNAGDQLLLADSGWSQGSNVSIGGTSYVVLNHSTLATLYVSPAISYPDVFVSAPTLEFANDTGIYSSDGVTYAGTVNVAGLEAGASWQYSIDAGQSWTAGVGSSFTLPANTYTNGTVLARQTDISGNLSGHGVLYAGFDPLASQRVAGMSGALDDTAVVQLKLANGGYVQAWTGATSDSRNTDIFIKRFAADGSAIAGSEKRVSATATNTLDSAPSLIELSGGRFVLAWTYNAQIVYLQMYNADWTAAGSAFTSTNSIASPNSVADMSITALADGGFVLAYTGLSNSPADSAIHVRKYDAQGTAGSVTLLGDTGSNKWDQNSKVSVDASGAFSVSWRGRAAGFDEVYVQDFLASGSTSGSTVKLPSSSGSLSPSIVKLLDGDWVFAVARSGTYGNDIHVNRYSSTGILETTTQLFGSAQASYQNDQSPQVFLLTDGGYVVVWSGQNVVNSVNQDYDIWVQKFAADGSLVGAKTYLSGVSGAYTDDSLTVGALSDGRYVVAWAGRTGSNASEKDVFFQAFNASGNRLGTVQQMGTPLLYSDSSPKVTALANGNFVVGWEGQTTDTQGIDVFSRIYSPGSLTVDTTVPVTGTLVSSGTFQNSASVTVQSADAGTAYLVNSEVAVTNYASIAAASDDLWNAVTITSINTDTSLALAGLAGGSYKVYITDTAGNTSSGSTGTITIQGGTSLSDITLDLSAASDTGSSSTDNLTRTQLPVITVSSLSGKAFTAGDLIEIVDTSNANAVVGSYTIQAGDLSGGVWSGTTKDITLTSSLSDGVHALKVRAKDATGVQGVASTTALTVTIDNTAPTLTWGSITETGFNFTASDSGSPSLVAFIGGTELNTLSVVNGVSSPFSVSEGASVLQGYFAVRDTAGNYSSTVGWSTTLLLYAGTSGVNSSSSSANVTQLLYGFGGNDFLTGWGWGDYIFGGDGVDNINGASGGDSLHGGSGDDVITGAGDNDTITGGIGADRITGGDGADQITLGDGADILVFDSLTGADTITDFVIGEDIVRLAKSAMAALGATGALTADEFVSGAGLTAGQDATDRIVYNTTNGALYYDADGSGAGGAAVLLATFTGAPVLTVSHFTVI
jgi:hypothetical protein